MAIDKEVLDQLLAGRDPQELFAKDGLLDELKKALSERMLSAELDDHLAAEAGSPLREDEPGVVRSVVPRDRLTGIRDGGPRIERRAELGHAVLVENAVDRDGKGTRDEPGWRAILSSHGER